MNKRLFIHIPKNAGMTIRKSPTLKGRILPASPNRHVSADYTKRLHKTMDAAGDHHGNEHARFRDIKKAVREAYPAFAILRNPWDRVFSRYQFARKVIYVERKVDPSYAKVGSFDEFLYERFKWGNKDFFWHRAVRGWFPQLDYVVDEKQNISVDCLRFEKLRTDVADYFGLIQFKDRSRNITAMKDAGTYKDIYNDKTIQIVADWYQKDIDAFGFDFDSEATKNYWNVEYP